MAIAFDAVPSNALVPLFWPEIRPAQAPFNSSLKMLLIGRATNTSTGAENEPVILSSSLAEELWGRGSMLAHMYETARLNGGPQIEIWGMALPKNVADVAATGSLTVTMAPPTDRTVAFLIGGRRVSVVVRKTDTVAAVATKLKNQINKQPSLSVVASVDGGAPTVVVLTCRWKGDTGNRIPISTKFWGGESPQAGQILNVAQMSGGTGEPSIGAALAALGAQEFDIIVPGDYTSSSRMTSYDDFMNGQTGRWSPYKQLYGHIFVGKAGAFADLITYADDLNDPHVSVIAADGSPTPMWEWGAAVGAHACLHWAAPPELSRPLQTLPLRNVLVPVAMDKWWDLTERQSLLEYGISTWRIGNNRQPLIDRIVTLRKDNAWGDPDPSWRDAVTMFQAMYFTRFMRAEITGNFPRAALTDENTGIAGFASPEQIKALILHSYRFLQRQGLVENYDLFAEALQVERSEVDANRVDILMRPDMVNQLRIVAVVIETHLQLTELSLASARVAA